MSKLLKAMADGLDPMCLVLNKGGSKGYTPPPPVQPTPAVEEASLEIEDPDAKKKLQTGKSTLKMPISPAADTGLKV